MSQLLDHIDEEFNETQEKLDLIRLKIIPILEKKLKQLSLTEEESNTLKTYYYLGGRLVDLRNK